MIVRELVTLLKFKTEGAHKLTEVSRLADAMQAKMKPLENYLNAQEHLEKLQKADKIKKSIETASSTSVQDAMQAKMKPLENYVSTQEHLDKVASIKKSIETASSTSVQDAVQAKMNTINNYKKELQELNAEEKKEVLSLNTLEKQAIKEVRAEQKAGEREASIARQEQLKHLQDVRNKLTRVGDIARRVSYTATVVATGAFVSAYREYKKYSDNLAQGKLIKTSFSKEGLEKFKQFDTALKSSKSNVIEVRNSIAYQLLPILTDLLNNFNKWYQNNKEFVNTDLVSWIKTATIALIAFKAATTGIQVAGAIKTIATAFTGVGANIGVANGGIAALALSSGVLLAKIALVGAALGLVIDDVNSFMKGGNSVLGVTIDGLSTLADKTKEVIDKYFNFNPVYHDPKKDIQTAHKTKSVVTKDDLKAFRELQRQNLHSMLKSAGNIQAGKTQLNNNINSGAIVINATYNNSNLETVNANNQSLKETLMTAVLDELNSKQQVDFALALQNNQH